MGSSEHRAKPCLRAAGSSTALKLLSLSPHPPCQTGLLTQVTCHTAAAAAWGHPALSRLWTNVELHKHNGEPGLWGRWKWELIANLELSVHAWMLRPEWLPQPHFRTCQVRRERLFLPSFQYTLMFLLSSDSSVTLSPLKAFHCIAEGWHLNVTISLIQ